MIADSKIASLSNPLANFQYGAHTDNGPLDSKPPTLLLDLNQGKGDKSLRSSVVFSTTAKASI